MIKGQVCRLRKAKQEIKLVQRSLQKRQAKLTKAYKAGKCSSHTRLLPTQDDVTKAVNWLKIAKSGEQSPSDVLCLISAVYNVLEPLQLVQHRTQYGLSIDKITPCRI